MSSEPSTANDAETQLRALIEVMAKLRDPIDGCAWDLEQDHASIAPYTIEEAYEVQDAIEKNDMQGLREELGDLLLQVVFQARIGEEAGHFDFADIAESITDKMIRRHPHIFGDHEYRTAEEQRQAWEDIKAEERQSKNETRLLDDVATTLPAMMRAFKLQKRAARVGFDWPDSQQVLDKVKEELAEVEAELTPEERNYIFTYNSFEEFKHQSTKALAFAEKIALSKNRLNSESAHKGLRRITQHIKDKLRK